MNWGWGGDAGRIFCFSFLMSSLIVLMGCLFGSRGGWSVEGVAFQSVML